MLNRDYYTAYNLLLHANANASMNSCLLLHLFCLPPAGGRIRSQGNLMLRLRRRTSDGMEK